MPSGHRTKPLEEMGKEGLKLYQYYDDGRLKWCRNHPGILAARSVDPDNVVSMEDYNKLIMQESNRFLGSLVGKTVVIFGTGPQLKRIDADWIHHLSKRDDTHLIGINAAPSVADKIWKVDADEVFDAFVAADVVFRNFFIMWGWKKWPKTVRFCKWKLLDGVNRPIRKCAQISGNAWYTYWVDSVTAAISISLAGLGTKFDRSGEMHKSIKSEGGRIILLGVEHNRWNHAYTSDMNFKIYDDPSKPWPNRNEIIGGHKELNWVSKQYGTEILNAAPWSAIKCHKFTDIEEEFSFPLGICREVSSGGMPEVKSNTHSKVECSRHLGSLVHNMHSVKMKNFPPRDVG